MKSLKVSKNVTSHLSSVLILVCLLFVLSSCSQGGYAEINRNKDLKTKDERAFIDAASEKFRLAIEKEIVTDYDEHFPAVYPEGYCGYAVDKDTNTVHVFLMDQSEEKEQAYLELLPEKYRQYLRFENRKYCLNDLNKIFHEVQTVLYDEGLSFGWNYSADASDVKISVYALENCGYASQEEITERIRTILKPYSIEIPYDLEILT